MVAKGLKPSSSDSDSHPTQLMLDKDSSDPRNTIIQQRIKKIINHELIGLQTKIIGSRNQFDVGIEGKIVDETRFTIVIQTVKETKRFLKENIIIKIGDYKIDGKLFKGKPEDRIKVKK